MEHYTAPAEPVIEYGGGGDEYAEYEGGVYEVGYDDSLMEGGTPSADGNKGRMSRYYKSDHRVSWILVSNNLFIIFKDLHYI